MSNVIDFLNERGFIDNLTSDELIKEADRPLKAYLGFDPTADSLHLGHLLGIVALTWLEKFGHTPIALVGGATARIGDPSGKNTERPLLSFETLNENIQGIEAQLCRCMKDPVIVNNNDWLGSYPLIDFMRDVGKHFRVGPMLGKESVRSRIQSEEGISFTEFSYQVMQGYDFYHLYKNEGVALQMGGSDQWGNITAGIELTRKLTGKSIYGMTFPLLTRSDGVKFGKSEGGVIWLDPQKTSPYQFYQYLVRVSDEDVTRMMRMLTFMELEEILQFEQEIVSKSFTPFAAQKRLAEEVTRFVHGEEGLKVALKVTEAAAPGSLAVLDATALEEIARDMPSATLKASEVIGQKYTDVAAQSGLFSSKGEAVRMVKNGGAYLNNEKVVDLAHVIEEGQVIGKKYLLFGAGKKKKILVRLQKELD